jgi:hypothetical protein
MNSWLPEHEQVAVTFRMVESFLEDQEDESANATSTEAAGTAPSSSPHADRTSTVTSTGSADWTNVNTHDAVKFFRLDEENNWGDQFVEGKLQIEKNGSGQHRMVMNDDVSGRVLVNMIIIPSNLYTMEKRMTKELVMKGHIIFCAKNISEDRDSQTFCIKADEIVSDALHKQLVEISESPLDNL